MCIVIDTNAFKKVFDTINKEHGNFKPVFDWIINGNGKLIIGGTKYKKEVIGKMQSNIPLIRELGRARKTCLLDDEKVDKVMEKLKTQITHRNFDDPHILAMCIVSKNKVVCTGDDRSHEFLKMKELYPKNHTRPSIYSGKHNSDLLTDKALIPCSKI